MHQYQPHFKILWPQHLKWFLCGHKTISLSKRQVSWSRKHSSLYHPIPSDFLPVLPSKAVYTLQLSSASVFGCLLTRLDFYQGSAVAQQPSHAVINMYSYCRNAPSDWISKRERHPWNLNLWTPVPVLLLVCLPCSSGEYVEVCLK